MTRPLRSPGSLRTTFLLAVLAALPVAAPGAELVWVSTGPLNAGRYLHTATRLTDGKVLVTGGGDTSSGSLAGLASAELYDPATDAWTSLAPMAEGRYSHTATLLRNGKVLVAGGGCGLDCFRSSAEVFDPATRTWAVVGGLALARDRHVAAALPDGRVLVAGGRTASGSTETAEAYDPGSASFSRAAPMAVARQLHTATARNDGGVLVAGGAPLTATVELYDPVAGTWTVVASMTSPRQDHAACLLADGSVLVAGGRFTFDPFLFPDTSAAEAWNGSTWSQSAMAAARDHLTATTLPDGQALVAGGAPFDAAATELFDPATGSWSPGPLMNGLRSSHTATLLADGRVLVAGAFGGGLVGGVATAEVLTPATPVAIDVKPGETTNKVNVVGKASISVAVLSAPAFDAPASLLVSSVRFGRTGTEAPPLRCRSVDVNGDRLADLVCAFDGPTAGFLPGDTVGVLRGLTVSRTPVVGRDTVQTIP